MSAKTELRYGRVYPYRSHPSRPALAWACPHLCGPMQHDSNPAVLHKSIHATGTSQARHTTQPGVALQAGNCQSCPKMRASIRLVVTDFDGTIFNEFESPPVPIPFQEQIRQMQSTGCQWIVATGRDMSSLMEAIGRARLKVEPDWVVLVEREIYRRQGAQFIPVQPWNEQCSSVHAELFAQIAGDIPQLLIHINANHNAVVYSDRYSPICVIGENNHEADRVYQFLCDYARQVPHLTVVRNDVYMRFAHEAFNKGSAVDHIRSLLRVPPEEVFIAGDHLNDIPMLQPAYGRCLAAPANAIPEVKSHVLAHGGYISCLPAGLGTHDALMRYLYQLGVPTQPHSRGNLPA